MKKKRIYLDYNATTPVLPEVMKEFVRATKYYANPSSLHQSGRQAKEIVEQSREAVAMALGTNPEHLIFTGSGSEGNAQVLKSVWGKSVLAKEPVHILISAIEHSSIRKTAEQLALFGMEVDEIPVDHEGRIVLDAIPSLLKPHTKLVSVVFANNEVGTCQPIQQLVDIVRHSSNALVHTDAVQALGKIPIDCQGLGVDFLTVSSHKVYAPKGVGALYVKDDKSLMSLIPGSSHERKLRAGTENVGGIAAFAEAVRVIHSEDVQTPSVSLIERLRAGLSTIPDVVFHTPVEGTLNTTLSVAFRGIDGHALAINLDLEGIDISTGAACSSGSIEPSHVLKAMGVSDDLNIGTIRISVGRYTTIEDINIVSASVHRVIKRMRI